MAHMFPHVWTGLRETRLRVTLLYAHAPSRDDSRVLPDCWSEICAQAYEML